MRTGENSDGIEAVTPTNEVMIWNNCFFSLISSLLLCNFIFSSESLYRIQYFILRFKKTLKNKLEVIFSNMLLTTVTHLANSCKSWNMSPLQQCYGCRCETGDESLDFIYKLCIKNRFSHVIVLLLTTVYGLQSSFT